MLAAQPSRLKPGSIPQGYQALTACKYNSVAVTTGKHNPSTGSATTNFLLQKTTTANLCNLATAKPARAIARTQVVQWFQVNVTSCHVWYGKD
jgi:hypothetical protein